jgi:hypothetical protein
MVYVVGLALCGLGVYALHTARTIGGKVAVLERDLREAECKIEALDVVLPLSLHAAAMGIQPDVTKSFFGGEGGKPASQPCRAPIK